MKRLAGVVTPAGTVSMQVRASRGRHELRFQLNKKEYYVGSYTTRAQALSSGTGMLERGEAVALFTKRRP